jgi:hypothetical protein
MTDRPLLRISWKDHCAIASWEDVEKFHSPAAVHSIGWLWKEDDEGITLCACFSPDEDSKKEHTTSCLQYILKSCITVRKEIPEENSE